MLSWIIRHFALATLTGESQPVINLSTCWLHKTDSECRSFQSELMAVASPTSMKYWYASKAGARDMTGEIPREQ